MGVVVRGLVGDVRLGQAPGSFYSPCAGVVPPGQAPPVAVPPAGVVEPPAGVVGPGGPVAGFEDVVSVLVGLVGSSGVVAGVVPLVPWGLPVLGSFVEPGLAAGQEVGVRLVVPEAAAPAVAGARLVVPEAAPQPQVPAGALVVRRPGRELAHRVRPVPREGAPAAGQRRRTLGSSRRHRRPRRMMSRLLAGGLA